MLGRASRSYYKNPSKHGHSIQAYPHTARLAIMPVRQWLSTAIYSGGRIAKQIDQLADTPKVVARGYIQKALNGLDVADLLGRGSNFRTNSTQ